MRFGVLSPDVKLIIIKENDDHTVTVTMEAATKKGRKKIEETIQGPKDSEDSMDWLKKNAIKLSAKLLMAKAE